MKLTKKTKSDRIQQHFTKVGSSWNSIFFFGVTYIFAGHVKNNNTHTHDMSLIQLAQQDSSIFQQSVIKPQEHIFTQKAKLSQSSSSSEKHEISLWPTEIEVNLFALVNNIMSKTTALTLGKNIHTCDRILRV